MGILEALLYVMWRGLAIGVIISAPMGPVGILCIQRTLEKGRHTGFYTGVGAALSDLFYCLLTGFGLSFIEEFLERNQNVIQLIGSAVLIAFGIYLFRSNPTKKLRKPEVEKGSMKKNILNGFLFTFSNPLIIFLIIGLFARFNFMLPDITFFHYIIGFVFIFLGALAWWWFVTFFVDKLRAHFNLRSMWLVNKIIGVVILIFAVVGIVTGVMGIAGAAGRAAPPRLPASLTLSNRDGHSGDTVIPLGSRKFTITFRAANTAARPTSKRPFTWGMKGISKNGEHFNISIRTEEAPDHEGFSSGPELIVTAGDSITSAISSGFDFYNGENAYRLVGDGKSLSLEGGNRSYIQLYSGVPDIPSIDSIGFFAEEPAYVEIRGLSMRALKNRLDDEPTEYGNPDILETKFLRSSDRNEGVWRLYDRSLDEDLLRTGGDYSLAMISKGDGGGYDLIYLCGAKKNSRDWRPGMVKGELLPSGFKDVYNVIWVDSDGNELSNELKGQIDGDILSISFPYQSSSIRLRKLSGDINLRALTRSE